MATTIDFIDYIYEQIEGVGTLRHRKMFGEYMLYVNDKPILLICDNTAYVKKMPTIAEKMINSEVGIPYEGAKEHYILDIDEADFTKEIIGILESVTDLPKTKKKKSLDNK